MEYLTYCLLVSIDKQIDTSAMFNRYRDDINNFLSSVTIQFTQSEVKYLQTREDLRRKIREMREMFKHELQISPITKNVDILLWKIRIWEYIYENNTFAHLININW